jgi:hypothetical protein
MPKTATRKTRIAVQKARAEACHQPCWLCVDVVCGWTEGIPSFFLSPKAFQTNGRDFTMTMTSQQQHLRSAADYLFFPNIIRSK